MFNLHVQAVEKSTSKPGNLRTPFEIHLGAQDPNGLKKGRRVGLAFLREGKHEYRLKFFAWPGVRYFLKPVDKQAGTYSVWIREEVQTRTSHPNVYWSEVGSACVQARYGVMEIKLDLCHLPLYMSLFPLEKIKPVPPSECFAKISDLKLIS